MHLDSLQYSLAYVVIIGKKHVLRWSQLTRLLRMSEHISGSL